MAPGAPPGARGARNATWKPYFALPGAAKIASGGLRERKINFVGAFRGALGRKVERFYPPGGSLGGSQRASGTSFWEHFCCKACRHEKSKNKIVFLDIFDVVFILFFVVLLRLPRCAGASAHLEKYWFSPGEYCKNRLSAIFARNQRTTELIIIFLKRQAENQSKKACR